jgi:lipoprotein-releasing system ATP-binding protein
MNEASRRAVGALTSQDGSASAGFDVGIDLGMREGGEIDLEASSDGRSAVAFPVSPPVTRDDQTIPEYQMGALELSKSYRKGGVAIPVLKGLNLGVRLGEFLAVVGQSGSGKSTLLHLLGTLDAPDDGAVYFEGERIDNLPSNLRDRLRNKHFGMIFQMYHLLPELTTLENVMAPLMIGDSALGFLRHRRKHRAAAAQLLETVGLGHRLKHKPRELSGGEMQRAAIARALVTGPQLLLADEPTGNLDRDTGNEILRLLGSLNRHQNLTIVMVTHDQAVAQRADRVVRLVDGRIEDI